MIYINGNQINTTEELTTAIEGMTTEQQEYFTDLFNAESLPVVNTIPEVTPRQIRQALFLQVGLTDADIIAALNTLTDPTKTLALIEWNNSNMFERNRPLVTAVGAMFGWTSGQLDDLWIYARTL